MGNGKEVKLGVHPSTLRALLAEAKAYDGKVESAIASIADTFLSKLTNAIRQVMEAHSDGDARRAALMGLFAKLAEAAPHKTNPKASSRISNAKSRLFGTGKVAPGLFVRMGTPKGGETDVAAGCALARVPNDGETFASWADEGLAEYQEANPVADPPARRGKAKGKAKGHKLSIAGVDVAVPDDLPTKKGGEIDVPKLTRSLSAECGTALKEVDKVLTQYASAFAAHPDAVTAARRILQMAAYATSHAGTDTDTDTNADKAKAKAPRKRSNAKAKA